MSSFENLLKVFNPLKATAYENMLHDALIFLIAEVERQKQQIEALEQNKADRETFYE